jgi:mRNA interferase MazF
LHRCIIFDLKFDNNLLLIRTAIRRSDDYPIEVPLPTGLKASGVVLADQVKSLDWKARGVKFVCTVPEAVVRDVKLKLGTLVR